MRKYKIGVIGSGNFDSEKPPAGGQEIKVQAFYDHFCEKFGKENVFAADSHNWKKHPIKTLFKTIKCVRYSQNIIIFPARNGIKVFPKIANIFRKKNSKIFILAIGGWLPDVLKKNSGLAKTIKKMDLVGVETEHMKNDLEQQGFKNITVVRNAKQFKNISVDQVLKVRDPIKTCTFSRIADGKGVSEAIEAVMNANKQIGHTAYTLTIYGAPQGDFGNKLIEDIKKLPEYIRYGGIVNTFESQSILSNFDILLFLTTLKGEGFPGTILDAYFSGLAIIGSDIIQLKELVKESNGFLIKNGSPNETASLLVDLYENQDLIYQMKITNLNESKKYSSERIFEDFDLNLL